MRMSRENIEKKRANTSVLIRKADAFGAVIEAAAREESENDVLKRIDRIPPVVGANVAFLCDGRKCDSCSGECKHTLDVSHAKNFSKRDGAFFENEEPQKDQPGETGGVFIPDVTVEMIRNAPLEGIEELLNNGEMYNVPEPTEDNRSLPAGDYIRRADAIDAVRVCDVFLAYQGDKIANNIDGFVDSIVEQMRDNISRAVSALPSAEAVQGWIPCEEEMPIDSEEVIASVYWTGYGDSIIAYGHYSARFDRWRLYSDMEGELIKGYEVTAWMPLPKPYKGGDSE